MVMAFDSIKEAIKFTALLRSYNGQGSSGEALYADPVMIKCYPAVENRYVVNSEGAAVFSKTILYVLPEVSVKEQDIILLENANPNWFGQNFASSADRNLYYARRPERLIANKTWCAVCGKAQFWDGADWSATFDGTKVDGEVSGGFTGKAETVKSVPQYFDGFGADRDADKHGGLSIQEIGL